jgi:hypothetical protein
MYFDKNIKFFSSKYSKIFHNCPKQPYCGLYICVCAAKMVIVGLDSSFGTLVCRFENCTHFILVRRKPPFFIVLLLEPFVDKFSKPKGRQQHTAPSSPNHLLKVPSLNIVTMTISFLPDLWRGHSNHNKSQREVRDPSWDISKKIVDSEDLE